MDAKTIEEFYRDESFRDSIATIDEKGRRKWIYPKKPDGRFYRARTWLSYVLITLLFAWPWIKVNGHPVMLFNVLERKFIIFGIVFWPQDFFLFMLAMITFIVFIILFTALFGRLWCGWACPQTIFMEMLFRKIEYLIEGDYMQQRALDKAPASPQKFFKKTAKHTIFFFISFLIANTFLAYLIGSDELVKMIKEGPALHKGGFISLLMFTGVFYGVFARFREQACIVVCPYGRLQGVLLDKNSVVIAYDYVRGEPREKLRKDKVRNAGDCIDCHQCVYVCPTGIDIRNGTQLECVNCAACIDACDSIMDRTGKPRGLIRYTSENAIALKQKFKITPRIIGYSVLLFVLASSLFTLLAFRSNLEATVLRVPGQLFQRENNNKISNLYSIKAINKTFDRIPVTVELLEPRGEIRWVGNGLKEIPGQGLAEGEFFIVLNQSQIKTNKTPVVIQLKSGEKIVKKITTSFLGPVENQSP